MMVRHLIHVLKTAIRDPVRTPLGRWNVENYKQTTLKIQYANEDNCGSCGEYNTKQIITQDDDDEDEKYIYIMGLDTVPTVAHIKHK